MEFFSFFIPKYNPNTNENNDQNTGNYNNFISVEYKDGNIYGNEDGNLIDIQDIIDKDKFVLCRKLIELIKK